jgi:hypothetical protein
MKRKQSLWGAGRSALTPQTVTDTEVIHAQHKTILYLLRLIEDLSKPPLQPLRPSGLARAAKKGKN